VNVEPCCAKENDNVINATVNEFMQERQDESKFVDRVRSTTVSM